MDNGWKQKLSSRKLWAMIVEFLGMMFIAFGMDADVAVQITALIMAGAGIMAYILGESWIDAKREEQEE